MQMFIEAGQRERLEKMLVKGFGFELAPLSVSNTLVVRGEKETEFPNTAILKDDVEVGMLTVGHGCYIVLYISDLDVSAKMGADLITGKLYEAVI